MTSDDGPRWQRLEPDARREEILAAAIRLFGDLPYSQVQMSALAELAGVARGLVHHYFGTKRELYLEVVRSTMTVPPLDDVRLPTGTLRERVEASVAWLVRAIEARGHTWVRVGLETTNDADVRALLNQADDLAAERVLQAIGFTASAAETLRARALIRSYGALVKASAREWIDEGTLDRATVLDLLTETLLALVRTQLPAENLTVPRS